MQLWLAADASILRECATAADITLAPTLAQQALQAALDFGLADLAQVTRAELADAIRGAVPTFTAVSGTFSLPPGVVKDLDDIVIGSPSAAMAIRQLAVLPGILEFDRATVREEAREQLKQSPFYALVPKVRYDPDGKVTQIAGSVDESLDWHAATLLGFLLTIVEAAVNYFLRQTIALFSPTTLLEALAEWPHLTPARRALLGASSERFHSRDWVSAGLCRVPRIRSGAP